MASVRGRGSALLLFVARWFAAASGAQSYPTKPVRYILPSTGASEIVGRLMAQGLSDVLRDFMPITRMTLSPLVVVHPSLLVKSIGEYRRAH